MDIRLIAVDHDGTLLKNYTTQTPATNRAVARASAGGVEVVFSTGRALCECRDLLAQLPDVHYAITCTGAQVLDCRTERELFFSPLHNRLLRAAWQRLRDCDVLFEVFMGSNIYVSEAQFQRIDVFEAASGNPTIHQTRTPVADFDGWIASLEQPATKIHMYFPDTAQQDAGWDRIRDLDLFICNSDPVDLEVMAEGIDKGTGLSRLADYLALNRSQVMAVGDSGNDLGMLEYAGVRAVMGNGRGDLKALADIIADTNEHDGVARLLEDLTAGVLDPGPSPRLRLH